MIPWTRSRYTEYGVIHAHTGEVESRHETRTAARAALNAMPTPARWARRVRGTVSKAGS